MKKIRILLFLFTIQSCSSFKTKTEKVLITTAVGIVGGFFIGQGMGTTEDGKKAFSSVGAGAGGVVASAMGTLFFDENSQDSQKILEENKKLSEEVKKYEKQFSPELISEGTGLNEQPLPEEAKKLIKQGKWQKFKLNRWVQDTEDQNTFIKQVEMYKFTPPSTGDQ